MSLAHRPSLRLESLDNRIVPAVIDLTSVGAEGSAPSGAIVSQFDTPTQDAINTFVRMQSSPLLGGLLGGLLGTGTEQGYNTNARPLQFDEERRCRIDSSPDSRGSAGRDGERGGVS